MRPFVLHFNKGSPFSTPIPFEKKEQKGPAASDDAAGPDRRYLICGKSAGQLSLEDGAQTADLAVDVLVQILNGGQSQNVSIERVVILDEGHVVLAAVLAQGLFVVGVDLGQLGAQIGHGLADSLLQGVLIGGIQAGPGILVHNHHVGVQNVVGAGQVLLNLLEVGAHAGVGGVLLSGDVAGLEGEEDLIPSHGGGLSFEGLPESHVVLVLHGADQQAVEVIDGVQRGVGGGQTVGSALEDAHELQAGVVERLAQLLVESAVAVEDLVDGGRVILSKDHGQVEDGDLGDEGHHGSGLADHQLNLVGLHLAQDVGVSAQLAVGEVLDG